MCGVDDTHSVRGEVDSQRVVQLIQELHEPVPLLEEEQRGLTHITASVCSATPARARRELWCLAVCSLDGENNSCEV